MGSQAVYIYVDVGRLTSLRKAELVMLWAPSLIFSHGREPSAELMVSDCSLTSFFSRKSIIQVLSSMILPSKNVKLVGEALVKAPELEPSGCTVEEFEGSVRSLLEMSSRLAESEVRLPGATRQALSHFLSPTRLVIGDTRTVGEGIGSRIASSVIAEIVSRITNFLSGGNAEVARVLYAINMRKPEAFVVIGDKLVKNRVISFELSRDGEALRRILALSRS